MLELLRSDPLLSSLAASVIVALVGAVLRRLHSRLGPRINAWATTTAVASRKNFPKVAKIAWSALSTLAPLWFMVYQLRTVLTDQAPPTREDMLVIAFWTWWLMFSLMTIAFPHMFGLGRRR